MQLRPDIFFFSPAALLDRYARLIVVAELPNDPLRSGTVTLLLLLFLRRPAVALDICVSIRRINLLARVSLGASLADRSVCMKT